MRLLSRLMLITSIVVPCGTLLSCGGQQSESSIRDLLKSKIVKVNCYDVDEKTLLMQGSGFFVGNDGTFITNAHVMDNSYYVTVEDADGLFTNEVTTINYINDTSSDFAICKAGKNLSTSKPSFSSSISNGDTVYAFGFPKDASTPLLTSGVIKNVSVTAKSKTYISNTAFIDHGSSGGILANANGDVIGITTGELTDGTYAAVPYSAFSNYLTTKTINKSPLEYYHDVTTVNITSSNIENYFDITYSYYSDSGFNTSIYLYLKLKDSILSYYKPKLTATFLSINLKLQITYTYKDSSKKTQTKTVYGYADIKFYQTDITTQKSDFIILTCDHDLWDTFVSKTNPTYTFSSSAGTLLLIH